MTTTYWYALAAGTVGLCLGLLIGTLRSLALRRDLAVKEAELRGFASADLERERALALAAELDGFRLDPTRHMLRRAARAARLAEAHTTGEAALIASVTATEIENDAEASRG